MKNKVQRAQLSKDNIGPSSYLVAVGLSFLVLPKEGLVPGNDVEAILARAQHWMRKRSLDATAREVNGSKGWPKRLAHDWLGETRQWLESEQVVEARDIQFLILSIIRSIESLNDKKELVSGRSIKTISRYQKSFQDPGSTHPTVLYWESVRLERQLQLYHTIF